MLKCFEMCKSERLQISDAITVWQQRVESEWNRLLNVLEEQVKLWFYHTHL